MIQRSLTYAPAARPLSRNTDPMSSHEAADEMEQSGKAKTHQKLILEFLSRCYWMSLTSHEVASVLPFDSVEAGRRLSDLKRDNLVEQVGRKMCSITGKRLTAWRLV